MTEILLGFLEEAYPDGSVKVLSLIESATKLSQLSFDDEDGMYILIMGIENTKRVLSLYIDDYAMRIVGGNYGRSLHECDQDVIIKYCIEDPNYNPYSDFKEVENIIRRCKFDQPAAFYIYPESENGKMAGWQTITNNTIVLDRRDVGEIGKPTRYRDLLQDWGFEV